MCFILETITLIILLICLGLVLGIEAFLLGLKLTSYKKRDYPLLNPDDVIIGQSVLSILEIYKPIFYQQAQIKKSIKFIFYEAIDQNDNLVLIYRPFWDDEIHPNFILNLAYKNYRLYYYGSIRDIEFVEMFIDKKTGVLQSFSFEALAQGSSINTPQHEFAHIIKRGQKYYNATKNNELVEVLFEKKQIVFQITTWNHLLALANEPIGEKINASLKPLTDKLYKKYAISRRSSGFIKTEENRKLTLSLSISLMAIFGLILPIVLYFLLG